MFSKFCLRRKKFGQSSIFWMLNALRELGKSIWSKIFWKIQPPTITENPRSALSSLSSLLHSNLNIQQISTRFSRHRVWKLGKWSTQNWKNLIIGLLRLNLMFFLQLMSYVTWRYIVSKRIKNRGGLRGAGGWRLLLRNLTPCRPKGSPFLLFWDIDFLVTDPKMFLKIFHNN